MPKYRVIKRFVDDKTQHVKAPPMEVEFDEARGNARVASGHVVLIKQKAEKQEKTPAPPTEPPKTLKTSETTSAGAGKIGGVPAAVEVTGSAGSGTPDTPSTTTAPLPESFPYRDKLVAAGFTTLESLNSAEAKAKVEAIPGITPEAVSAIGQAAGELLKK